VTTRVVSIKQVYGLIAGYDRRLWVLFFVQMLVSIGFGAAMPFVSLYLHRELGVSMTVVGTIMLAAALVSAIGRIIGGEIADRFGRKPVIYCTMAARTVIFLLMTYVIHIRAGYLLVGFVFLAIRFAGALIQPAISAMVADIVTPKRQVEAFGILRIGLNAGWAIGPAIGGFLVMISYSSVFLVSAVVSLIGFIATIRFTTESIRIVNQQRFRLKQLLAVGKNCSFLVFCFFSFVLFLVMGQLTGTLAVFAAEIVGLSKLELGFLYTLNGLVVVLLQWPAARLSSRLGRRRALVIGSLLYALGYFSVGLVPSFVYLLGAMIVITLGEIIFSPTATATVAAMAADDQIGRYMGFFGLAEAFGWSVGLFVSGLLFDAFATTPIILWGAIAALGLIAAIGFAICGRHYERSG
jgi:MFS family permease